ncbi:outer membrane beta-barrel protein (plasmid) [Pseudoalteromonas espejiana]
MSTLQKSIVAAITLVCATPTLASAEGFYGTAHIGYSSQANDSQAIGNNIAVDADFPSEFDAGDGSVGSIGLGYQFNPQFRVEARISYHDTDYSESKVGLAHVRVSNI